MTDLNDFIFHLVGGHGVVDPSVVVADLGVDARPVLLGAAITPGHNALKLTIAHHGATRVTLKHREGMS